MRRKILLTALLCCIANVAFSQLTLRGKVVDEKGNALMRASVWIEYSTIGASTDEKGEFVLRKVPEGKHILRATSIDYDGQRKEVQVSDENILFTLNRSPFKLNEVVVTGTGTHRRLKNSPIAIDVISKRELENVNIPTFENAMIALNPSFSFTPNVMGSFMQLNGLTNKYILVLVDGKKLAGDVSRNTDLSRINMDNIKRIEILKGAASSLYGSEAIAGVVNIITDKHKESVYLSSNTRYSKYNQFTQSLNADVNYKGFSSSTSFQRNQTDGWQLSSKEATTDKKTGETILIDTDKKAVNCYYSDIVSQKFSFDPSSVLSFYTEGSLFDKKYKRPPDSYKYDLKYNDYTFGVGAKYLLKGKGVINLDMYTDNFEYTKVYIAESGEFKIGDEERSRRQKYYDINLRSALDFGKQNRVTIGTQYQIDYIESESDVSDGSSRDRYTWSLYAQDEIKLLDKKLQFIPGVRYVYNEAFKSKLTPKFSAMYSPSEYFNFRASYSMGFRTPDMKELYIKSISGTTLSLGDANLKPETSSYYSLNAEYIHRFFTFSVTGYTNRIKDIIVARNINETITPEEAAEGIKKKQLYTNSSKARVNGIEFNINSYLGSGFTIGGGYSYIDSKDYDTGRQLQKVSRHTGNVNANWAKKWWIFNSNFNLTGRIQSRRYYEDGDARSFNLWNLSTNHRMKSFNGLVLEPGFGIENILDFVDDKPFGSNYATLSSGRTFYVSLSLRFSK
ncbi:MAG: TonB-dependent receptor [Dysgonomonas sp.]|nr:TonB-dependent receptor [Dysgonomonas sp.]